MPTSMFYPSRNAIILVAVVEREHTVLIKHAISPNHPPQHLQVIAAQTSLIHAPDFIFPPHLPPPDIPPRLSKPSHPTEQVTRTPESLPISSSAVYLALSDPASEPSTPSVDLPPTPRAVSNFSSLSPNLSRTPTFPRRPISSPPAQLSAIDIPPSPAPAVLQSRSSSSSTDPALSGDESCPSSFESRRLQFRTTLLSATTHVFAITAQDGSRQYAFCRPLSSTHAVVIVTTLSHTALYVSALERTAATYALLVDDALSNPTAAHTHSSQNSSNPHRVCSSFVADNVMRCPQHIAVKLTEALLACINSCSISSFKNRGVCETSPSCSTSYIPPLTQPIAKADTLHQTSNVENKSPPCLASSTESLAPPRDDSTNSRTPANPPDRTTISDCGQQKEGFSLWNAEVHSSGTTQSSNNRSTAMLSWDVLPDVPNAKSFSVARVIELADATVLLRHFSVRSLISIVVALLEERSVCFVGPNTAVVSRAVLALDNLVRPFKWPHLISPILLARMLLVLSAPFPYLVGILDRHFPATKELPLENIVFADISSGKITTVDCPGELYRHIPRRIRSRLERRLARAKIACTRQILRSRSTLFSPVISNNVISVIDVDDHEELAKKEKPSLLKRSRSFVRINEGSPQNVWLDHETTATVDKTMRKFFSELLEGFLDAHDVGICNRLDLDGKSDGFDPLLPQTSSLAGVSVSTSKRDSEKRQLAKSFQRTQMFMQWRNEDACDPSFGMVTSEAEPQHGNVSRKRSKDRDISSQPKKATADADEDIMMKSPKFKTGLTSDMDDMFSGDDGMTGETGVVRKRFRGKRKLGRRQGVRLQLSADTVKNEIPGHDAVSSTDDNSSKPPHLPSTAEMTVSADHGASPECEADLESEVPSRRPWLPLRLPSSPWTATREWTGFSGREGDTESEICDHSDEGEETDPFDEPEESVDINNIFPIENVGTSWTRMRQWSMRKNKKSVRV